jgi:hypothetical protein
MKKKKINFIVVIILILALIPIPMKLKDGGSVEYKAILYEVKKYHTINTESTKGYDDGLKIKILGLTIYDKINTYIETENNDDGSKLYENSKDCCENCICGDTIELLKKLETAWTLTEINSKGEYKYIKDSFINFHGTGKNKFAFFKGDKEVKGEFTINKNNEMMLGLESWIPIYMTGQISPYYLSNLKNNIYNHLNYVSAAAALSGECINGFHNKGMYYLTTNKNEIEYYKEKSDLLLKKAKPLMEIYRESNIKEYHLFLKKDENIECDRTRYISSLPLFTISDELLIKILKRNKLTKEEIDKIIKYKNNEFKYMNSILKKNKVFDYIYVIKEDEFISDTPSLLLNNLFIDKTINYTYKEYIEHLKLTNEYSKNNKNYNILTEKDKTFKNITITILKNNHVIISKNSNPTIHFVIRHPKLVVAIESFNPLVKEL